MRFYLALGLSLLALSVFYAGAQQTTQAQTQCSALVAAALSTLEAQCDGAPGNSACYGNSAQAVFADDVDEADFSNAGDVIDLAGVEAIQTRSLDLENLEWGLALINVHANVPLAHSERGLTYLLIGDVEVENAVPFDAAFTPAEPVTVTAIVGANIRSAPNTDARVLGGATAGQELLADGLSGDQGWLRVQVDSGVAWISRQVIAVTEGDIDALPLVGANTRSLMQSFILRTGSEESECAEAPPSMLVIQSPRGVSANITVNGADVRISSTVVLRLLPDNVLQLITLDGGAYSGTTSIPAGLTMFMQLSEDGRSSAGPWRDQRAINEDEREFLLALEDFAPGLWHYVVSIPTQQEITTLLGLIGGAGTGGGASGPAAGQVNCSGFRPTSPLDGLAFGPTTFFWDSAPGATHYQLRIVNASGNLVRSVEVPGGLTTLTTNTNANNIGDGQTFTWYVDAMVDGQLACSSPQVTLARASGVGQPVGDNGQDGGPTPCPWEEC
jgi:hypothetical protein